MLPTLHQFRFSHFNEKVRWALDYKRVPHHRRSYLPGMHILPMLYRSRQKQLPVWCEGPTTIAGSAAILDHLERTWPDPPLLPGNDDARAHALELQRWFDDVGAPLRAAAFVEWLGDGRYMVDLFTAHARRLTRAAYRAAYPVLRAAMRADMGLSAERAAEGLARTAEAFAFVAERAGPGGYLAGDTFTIADLTAAAILSPAVLPAEFPYPPPRPHSPSFRRFLDRWADHPGAAWVREIYRRHRGTSAEVEA